jgi:hypothetical protein
LAYLLLALVAVSGRETTVSMGFTTGPSPWFGLQVHGSGNRPKPVLQAPSPWFRQ